MRAPTKRAVRRLDLLRGICSLGHAMHMSVIVEGVESLDIAVWLRTIGCDAVQGLAISRPLLAAEFPDWYKRESPSVAASLVDAVNMAPPRFSRTRNCRPSVEGSV